MTGSIFLNLSFCLSLTTDDRPDLLQPPSRFCKAGWTRPSGVLVTASFITAEERDQLAAERDRLVVEKDRLVAGHLVELKKLAEERQDLVAEAEVQSMEWAAKEE